MNLGLLGSIFIIGIIDRSEAFGEEIVFAQEGRFESPVKLVQVDDVTEEICVHRRMLVPHHALGIAPSQSVLLNVLSEVNLMPALIGSTAFHDYIEGLLSHGIGRNGREITLLDIWQPQPSADFNDLGARASYVGEFVMDFEGNIISLIDLYPPNDKPWAICGDELFPCQFNAVPGGIRGFLAIPSEACISLACLAAVSLASSARDFVVPQSFAV